MWAMMIVLLVWAPVVQIEAYFNTINRTAPLASHFWGDYIFDEIGVTSMKSVHTRHYRKVDIQALANLRNWFMHVADEATSLCTAMHPDRQNRPYYVSHGIAATVEEAVDICTNDNSLLLKINNFDEWVSFDKFLLNAHISKHPHIYVWAGLVQNLEGKPMYEDSFETDPFLPKMCQIYNGTLGILNRNVSGTPVKCKDIKWSAKVTYEMLWHSEATRMYFTTEFTHFTTLRLYLRMAEYVHATVICQKYGMDHPSGKPLEWEKIHDKGKADQCFSTVADAWDTIDQIDNALETLPVKWSEFPREKPLNKAYAKANRQAQFVTPAVQTILGTSPRALQKGYHEVLNTKSLVRRRALNQDLGKISQLTIAEYSEQLSSVRKEFEAFTRALIRHIKRINEAVKFTASFAGHPTLDPNLQDGQLINDVVTDYDDIFDDGQLEAPVNMQVTKDGIYAIYNVYSLSEIKPDMVTIYRIIPFPTKVPEGKLLLRDDVMTNIVWMHDFLHCYANVSTHKATSCVSKAACHFYTPFTQAQSGRTCIEDYIVGHVHVRNKLCPFTVELEKNEFFYQAIDATYYSVLEKVKYAKKCRSGNGTEIVEDDLWLENRGILVIPENCWVAIATNPIQILFPSPSKTDIASQNIKQTKVRFTGVDRYVRALNDHPKGTDLRIGVTLKPDSPDEVHEYIDPWGRILEPGSPISILFWMLLIGVPIVAICVVKILIKRYLRYITQTPPPTPVDLEMQNFVTPPLSFEEHSPMGIPSAPCQSPLTAQPAGHDDTYRQDRLYRRFPYVDDQVDLQMSSECKTAAPHESTVWHPPLSTGHSDLDALAQQYVEYQLAAQKGRKQPSPEAMPSRSFRLGSQLGACRQQT
jgi:hypothetical protein